jgi:hypothetical protein
VAAVQHAGLTALPWTTALAYLGFTLLPYGILVPRVVRRLEAARRAP